LSRSRHEGGRRGQVTLRTSTAWLLLALLSSAACNQILGIGDPVIDPAGTDASTALPDASEDGANDARPEDATATDAGSDASLDANDAALTCDADLATDPDNCGACAHGCLGGTCDDGGCTASIFADGYDGTNAVVVDQTYVYWTNTGGSGNPTGESVMRAKKDDPTNLLLLASLVYPHGLAQSGGSLFYTQLYTDGTGKCSTSVQNSGAAFSTGAWGYRIATDATYVYWTTNAGTILRVPQNGATGPTTIVSGEVAYPPEALWDIAVDDTYVYWTVRRAKTQGGAVKRAPKAGGGAVTVVSPSGTAPGDQPLGVAVDTNYVYWTESADGTVWKASLAGGTIGTRVPVASNQNGPAGIAVDTTHIYWATTGGSVWRAPIAGGTATPIATGLQQLANIALDSVAAYVTSPLGPPNGKIYRIAK
jgi:hypothetical protein